MSGDGWLRGPQWASDAVRLEWQDRIEAAAKAWEELEVLSVTAGIRRSALIYLSPSELVTATAAAAAQGMAVTPLVAVDGSIRCALSTADLAATWIAAWRASNNALIGELLGFPKCCIEFFARVWDGAHRDTTWAMVADGIPADGPIGANILLRRLGVRLVPHLPCSFQCRATAELAGRMLEAGRAAGIEDVDEISRLLALPMKWGACNGAAVLQVADLFRFAYETDPSPAVSFSRAGVLPVPLEPPVWRDNGFASRSAMDAAHAVVASVVGGVESAIDLGAGDGALLARIAAGQQGQWWAIEADPGRAARGAERRSGLRFVTSRIEDPKLSVLLQADVALLMPGRLAEMKRPAADRVRKRLPHPAARCPIAKRLVIYAYGDHLADGGLARLFVESGLPGTPGQIIAGPGVEAAEVFLA